jgi:pimeloyl-ACP methyl ester carboxylesterase
MEWMDIHVGGMVFDVLAGGMQNDGEAVVLLHGFPETAMMWLPVLHTLADEGYRVIAPNQRGYSPRATPFDIESYQLPLLVDDVLNIADAVGFTDKFHLVGHDWGAICGWACLELHHDRFLSWTSLSIPHAGAYYYTIYNDPLQYDLSFYIVDRVIEGIPEREMAENDFARLRKRYVNATQQEIDAVVEVFASPKTARGATNWYRANNPYVCHGNCPTMAFGRDITVPVLYIEAKRDHVVSPASVALSRKYMQGEYLHEIHDLSHYMVQEDPEGITESILSFIKRHSAT